MSGKVSGVAVWSSSCLKGVLISVNSKTLVSHKIGAFVWPEIKRMDLVRCLRRKGVYCLATVNCLAYEGLVLSFLVGPDT